MMLYSRTITTRGPQAETMAWAAEITAHVNAKTGLNAGCWLGLYGVPLGTLGWSAVVETHAELAGKTAALVGDAGFAALVAKAADWVVGSGEDTLRSLISGGRGDAGPPPVGAVAGRNTAVIDFKKFAEAMAWGIEIAEYTSAVGGAPVGFFNDLYGVFGTVSWISSVNDMAALDKSTELINADAGYMQRISAAGDLFVPASATSVLLTRIA